MAEFEKMVKSMNKVKEFKETLEKEEIREPDLIPWVDKPRLQEEISIDLTP